MQILITGRGVDLTDAIESYVSKKVNGLDKFFSGIIRADVILGKTTNHRHKGDIFFAESKLEVPGYEVFVKKEAADIYQAIDVLRDELEAELKKYKVKLHGSDKKNKVTGRSVKEYDGSEEI